MASPIRAVGTALLAAVAAPVPAGRALHRVKVLAADDVWAVGDNANRTLVTHWNGTAWTTVPSPNPDPDQDLLAAVDGVAPNDLWAVGNLGSDGYGGGTVAGMVLRWDGAAWTRVPVPGDPGVSITQFRDVLALAANDVWIVGTAFSFQSVTN